MQYKSDVYTINNAAPPSYAEVMGQVSMENNANVSPPDQTTTSYNQESTPMPDGVSPPTAPYPYTSNNFYSNIPTTTPYPIYPLNPQNQSQTTIHPSNTIIAVEEDATTRRCMKIALICRVILIIKSCIIVCIFLALIFNKIFNKSRYND